MRTPMNLRPAAALAALMMAGGLAGCQGDRNAFVAPPPPAVTLGQPAEKPLVDYLQFTGTIRPRETVDLRARVNGYLEKINFTDGAMVSQGDVLFTIEREPIEAELAVAKADLQKAKAQLQLAESELVRYRSLLMRNAATVQEVDVKTAERASAEAAVAAAEATQRQSEIQLGYTEVRAPISGRIGRRLVDVGNLVQAEMTLLGTIESVDPVYVYFTISEDDVLDLARGGSSVLRTGSQEDGIAPELQMALSDEEGYPHIGKLDYADLGVDSDTGTRQYRGVFPNPDRLLVPGLFTRVRTPLADARSRLMVPESALGLDQQGYYVMVVEATERKASIPAPGGGAPGGPPPAAKKEGPAAAGPPPGREVPVFVAHRRNVKVGTASEGMLSVESGLEGDETIIISGLQRVRDGGDIVDNLELAKPPAVAEAPAPPAAAARKGG